ncbi:MAG: hypothetical protein GTO45_11705 [Candidatus Aminicenantes bacterium]|nr:hypothetical protein [Candidatus Aminicenantes bacterium]NIM79470.1 hypothetical protein [Candidatus Aminicenantes bacterium]NIN18756.1 hypothetical protein [Candidatus Aminicenantes bacterium]NIN42678.1 hypothetical protein [Candidatus Aminicenantes bacterium]NIN85412.1 hypothetical protein [Candidatus Aminicenantes bacterium]
MNILISLIKRNFKHPYFKWIIIIMLPIVIISGYGVHKSVNEFRQITANSKEFQESELAKFTKIANYQAYSLIGFSVLFIPESVSSVFFDNPSYMNEISARINSLATLDIKKNCMGKEIRREPSFNLRLSNIVLWLFSLAGLLLGWEVMQNREFLKSLASRCSILKLFLSIIFSRFILLIFCLLVLFACMVILLMVENVGLASVDFNVLGAYPVVTLIILLFFPLLGTLAGYIRCKMISIPLLSLVWVFFIILVPIIVNSISDEQSEDIPSSYKVYCDKLKIYDDFEKRMEEKYGKFNKDDMETERKIVEYFWEHVYPEVEALDRELRRLHQEEIKKYHRTSVLTPTTLYNVTCNELSSRGDRNFLAFFDSLIGQKKGFGRHWIDQVYYKESKKLVNFITGDENIFRGKTFLPFYFIRGVLVNLAWILLAAAASYCCFTRYLYSKKSEEITCLGKVKMKADSSKPSVWLTLGDNFRDLLFNLLSGKYLQMHKKGFSGEVLVQGTDIAKERTREDFLYIFRPGSLPVDMTPKDFLFIYADMHNLSIEEKQTILDSEEIKPIANIIIAELTNIQKFEVLLALTHMKEKQIYLIDNISSYLPIRCAIRLKDRMDRLTEKGAAVIYLTDGETVDIDLAKLGKYYYKGSLWSGIVEEERARIKWGQKKKEEEEK